MKRVALFAIFLIIMIVICSCGNKDNEKGIYSSLDDAKEAVSKECDIKLCFKEPVLSFETDDAIFLLYLGEGEETRVAVYSIKIDKTDEGYIINGTDSAFTDNHHFDISEPIYQEIQLYDMNIEGTGKKFVIGKAFWKRYKPHIGDEYYGRLDRNNMFYYVLAEDENVEIEYR